MDNQKKIQTMSTWELAEFLKDVSACATKFTVCEEPCKSCERSDSWCTSEIAEWLRKEADNGDR